MESLALVAVIVLFTSFVGGPVAILLTFLPDKPTYLRAFRTVAVILLSLVGILFGYQLALSADIPAFPKLIGFSSFLTSVTALLYEFKVLKHKNKVQLIENETGGHEEASSQDSIATKKLYAVIFKSKRKDANSELYYEHNDKLQEKIKTIPGYIKHFGVRHPETREGITVVYFETLDAIKQWRDDFEHMAAKDLAKTHFYENYSVEILELQREYSWEKD